LKTIRLSLQAMACIACLTILSCGFYSFTGNTLPPHIRTVSIPLFENGTSEFGIDQQLTDGIIQAVIRDNTLKIARAREGDSVLKGRITRVEDRAGQYDQSESVSDYRIYLSVSVSFEDVRKQQVLWEETFSQFGTYSGDRDEGIQEAVEKLTADIVTKTVSGW